MLPPSARGRTLCCFGIVLLLAPVLSPPPPTLQRGALGCWRSRPAATPLRAAALLRLASGPCLCFHTRPYPCLLACPTLSASGTVVFPPACNMGRVALCPDHRPYREQQQQQRTDRGEWPQPGSGCYKTSTRITACSYIETKELAAKTGRIQCTSFHHEDSNVPVTRTKAPTAYACVLERSSDSTLLFILSTFWSIFCDAASIFCDCACTGCGETR